MTAIAVSTSPPGTHSLPNLRPARLGDYPQIQRLEHSHGLLTLSEENWRTMWLENPLRDRLGNDLPFGWVLEDDTDRIVGHLANVPTLYTLDGQQLVAVTGRAWVVAAEYRGAALWLMDEYFSQPGVDLFINTTVNAHAVDAFTTFGSRRVPIGNWESAAFWITSHREFARTALRLKHIPLPRLLSRPAGAALRLKDFLLGRSPRNGSAHTIDCIYSFDPRFDLLWKSLAKLHPDRLLCQRDLRSLNWHFAGPLRTRSLQIFTATSNNLLRAYCILKRQDHPPSGLKRMRLVDYQNVDPDCDHLPALLHAALARCIDDEVHTFEHVGCDLLKMVAFDRHAPYRRKLPAWPFYYQATNPILHDRLGHPGIWDPSSYDGDASL